MTFTNRLNTRLAILAAALMLGVTACDNRGAASSDSGGTMIVVVPAEPSSLFPPSESATEATMVIAQLFDRLAEPDSTLNTRGDKSFIPSLAESWEWSPDSMSIAFTIHSKAIWHDGTPVSAEDVRYTFGVYQSPVVASTQRGLISNIDSVSVVDSRIARFWFKRRTPQQFFDATYHMYVLPSHVLASIADSALRTSQFTRSPIGTGRFRFQRWDAEQRIEVVADTLNHRGRALLDRVVFSFTGDAGAATVRLFAGEADMFEQIRPENFDQVARSPSLRLVRNPTLMYQYVGFNFRDPKDTLKAHPIFSDVAVRRALVLATDRDRITRSIFDTLGATSIGPAPRALFGDTTTFSRPSFSVERAVALLDSAGWRDSDGDGIRDRDGVKLSFELLAPSTSVPRVRAATQLMEQLRRIGVEVKPLVLDPRNVMQPRMMARNFDAIVGGFQPTPGLRGVPVAWSANGRQNFQHYSSAAFDAALEEALSTFDEAKSKAAFGRAMQTIWDDAPAIWLFEPQNPIALHKRIQHGVIRADGWYYGLANWSVDPNQQIDRDRIGLPSGGGSN